MSERASTDAAASAAVAHAASATDAPRGARIFELHVGDDRGQALVVVSFRGVEELSRTFSFEILVTGAGPEGLDAFVGKPATLTIRVDGKGSRAVHGVLASAEALGHPLGHPRADVVRLVPRLWLLSQLLACDVGSTEGRDFLKMLASPTVLNVEVMAYRVPVASMRNPATNLMQLWVPPRRQGPSDTPAGYLAYVQTTRPVTTDRNAASHNGLPATTALGMNPRGEVWST